MDNPDRSLYWWIVIGMSLDLSAGIERADNRYLFALNIDIAHAPDTRLRSDLLKLILIESGFISP
jgi:hypothetical protein